MNIFTTKENRNEEVLRRCPNCQSDTTWKMRYCEIEVDQRDSDGIPIRTAYNCAECNHDRVQVEYVTRFDLTVWIPPTE